MEESLTFGTCEACDECYGSCFVCQSVCYIKISRAVALMVKLMVLMLKYLEDRCVKCRKRL